MTLTLPRRSFLHALTGLVAAPAIVRAENLMRISASRGLGPDWRDYVREVRIDYACVPPGTIVCDLSYDFHVNIFSPPRFTLAA